MSILRRDKLQLPELGLSVICADCGRAAKHGECHSCAGQVYGITQAEFRAAHEAALDREVEPRRLVDFMERWLFMPETRTPLDEAET